MSEHLSSLESFSQMEAWLEAHPVQIPQEILDLREQWKQRNDNPNLSEDEWGALMQEMRDTTSSLEGTEAGMYHRLAKLREHANAPGVRSEIFQLQLELSFCFCGSGKKFKKCHGK